jgi:hypothetical protein
VFLQDPPHSEEVESEYAADRKEDGYVSNFTRLWSWRPGLLGAFFEVRAELTVNDALGAAPDKQLADAAPEPIRSAVTYGRAPSAEPSRA